MTKQEQLAEYNIQDIIEYIVIDNNVEYDMAMQMFFNSVTFEKLMDLETGLYIQSSAYIYSLFCDEMSQNGFNQNEI